MGVHRKDRVSGWIGVGPTRWCKANNAPEQVLGELQLSQQLTLHSNHTYRDNKVTTMAKEALVFMTLQLICHRFQSFVADFHACRAD